MTHLYILRGHEPVPCDDMAEYSAFWRDPENRRVAHTEIGPAVVSTVFLSIDHGWSGGKPVLFESMVFWEGHELHQDCTRYHTWAEAERGHADLVAQVRAAVSCSPGASPAAEEPHP